MSTGATVAIVVAGVIIILVAAAFAMLQQRRKLRRRFGPEYDRLAEEHGSKRAADAELKRRQDRAAELDIRPLSEDERRRYSVRWVAIQEEFVDRPREALAAATNLITSAMRARGYPTDSYDQIQADLSVEHARTLGQFRKEHEISAHADSDSISTEDLRQSMIHYREVFEDLVGTRADGDGPPDTVGSDGGRTVGDPRPKVNAPDAGAIDEPA